MSEIHEINKNNMKNTACFTMYHSSHRLGSIDTYISRNNYEHQLATQFNHIVDILCIDKMHS